VTIENEQQKMKSASKLIFVVAFFALAASAYGQSPREQLNQMVQQLQKTPTDYALRMRIIKLAAEMRPAPAIPEEAREPFIMGVTVLKKASDPAGARKAVDLFTQALNIAPWFADAYYNRAIARETAGQFEPAIDDLKLFLEFKLTDSERRQAQDKIYALKAEAQIASVEDIKRQAQSAATAQAKRFEGNWYRDVVGGGVSTPQKHRQTLTIRRGTGDIWRFEGTEYEKANSVRDIQLVGSELRFKYDYTLRHPDRVEVTANIQAIVTVAVDGNTLKIASSPMPLTPSQAAYWARWGSPPNARVDEYKRE
jgi:tetratricopeptide (TPR) repeat protein